MKISHANQRIKRKNSEICIVIEYPPMDPELDFAIVHISGRYPPTKAAVNTKCKEIIYVNSGSGRVVVNQQELVLQAGDVVIIDAEEKFYWEGNMVLHISCTPAFNVEQHQIVDLE